MLGNDSRAVVEFAPYQKTPREQKTADARQGTIDEDPDYLNFLKFLEAENNKDAETQEDANNGLNPIEKLENRIAMNTGRRTMFSWIFFIYFWRYSQSTC